MLISDSYREEQVYLHYQEKMAHKYGSGGPSFAKHINHFIDQYGVADLLDYGCGKGILAKTITRIPVQCYDPAVEEFKALPFPAEMTVCLDVLEHIEPECLHDVLTHINQMTLHLLFVSISVKKAWRVLRDGRNAHLIVKEPKWWKDTLERYGFALVITLPTDKLEWVALLRRQPLSL